MNNDGGFPKPTCRNGHGPMTALRSGDSEWFGMSSVNRFGSSSVGVFLVYRVFSCATCGYMELQDVPQQEYEQTTQSAVDSLTLTAETLGAVDGRG